MDNLLLILFEDNGTRNHLYFYDLNKIFEMFPMETFKLSIGNFGEFIR